MSDKLQDVLAGLATQLGTTAEHLWPLLVKYRMARVVGEETVVLALFAIGVALFSKMAPKGKWDEGWPCNPQAFMAGGGGLLAAVGCLLFLGGIPRLVATFIAPEASTVIWLMDLVTGSK